MIDETLQIIILFEITILERMKIHDTCLQMFKEFIENDLIYEITTYAIRKQKNIEEAKEDFILALRFLFNAMRVFKKHNLLPDDRVVDLKTMFTEMESFLVIKDSIKSIIKEYIFKYLFTIPDLTFTIPLAM